MALPVTPPTAAIPTGTGAAGAGGAAGAAGAALSSDQLLEIYYYLRLTRTLEERLGALYRPNKGVGGLFRSLGQEGESGASAYSLGRGRHQGRPSPPLPNPRA